MIYLYLFGTCFHFIYVFMIIWKYFHYNVLLVFELQMYMILLTFPVCCGKKTC